MDNLTQDAQYYIDNYAKERRELDYYSCEASKLFEDFKKAYDEGDIATAQSTFNQFKDKIAEEQIPPVATPNATSSGLPGFSYPTYLLPASKEVVNPSVSTDYHSK